MTNIYLIRHAEAEGNVYRRAHGHFNGQITKNGYAQIELLRERFINERIDAVYSSDLARTVTTATAISDNRALCINKTAQLREVDMGEWEDNAWGDIIHAHPDMSDYFGSDPAKWRVKGGEDYYHVRRRIRDAIGEIGRKHDGGCVAVFSHGFAIRSFICDLMSIPSPKVGLLPYCDNTAVASLRFEDDVFAIIYHGDNTHLRGGKSTFEKQTWWRDKGNRRREDLRYAPFDRNRDAAILDLCGDEKPTPSCDGDFTVTALQADEPVGIIMYHDEEICGERIGIVTRLALKEELKKQEYIAQLVGYVVSDCQKRRMDKVRIIGAEQDSKSENFSEYGFKKTIGNDSYYVVERDLRVPCLMELNTYFGFGASALAR